MSGINENFIDVDIVHGKREDVEDEPNVFSIRIIQPAGVTDAQVKAQEIFEEENPGSNIMKVVVKTIAGTRAVDQLGRAIDINTSTGDVTLAE